MKRLRNTPPTADAVCGNVTIRDLTGSAGECERATIRTIARAAGVSPMTVSRALRAEKGVRPAIRERVLAEAKRQRYRPQPQIQKLMTQLAQVRRKQLISGICALTTDIWPKNAEAYYCRMFAGAKIKAQELGFTWETVPLAAFIKNPRWAVRILRNRGVEGILFLPTIHRSKAPSDPALWADFSIVSATHYILDPGFHKVTPDQFRNMLELCERLSQMGCQRIGMVATRCAYEKVHHYWSGAMAAFHIRERREFSPLAVYCNQGNTEELRSWFKGFRPDAIITETPWWASRVADCLGLPLCGPITFGAASYSGIEPVPIPNVDECPEQIGLRAAERLASMITSGERGVPKYPSVTMIQGNCRLP